MKLKCREWTVAVAARTDNNIKNLDFKCIANGKRFWVADPFPFEYKGCLYIFGEVFDYLLNKGTIGFTKLENNRFTPWKVVIHEDYHMSFPYIFEYCSDIYICPESSAAKQLYLYKAKEFPYVWEKDLILCDNCNFSDTVFYKKNNGIYGFTSEWSSIKEHKLKVFRLNNSKVEISDGKIETLDYYLTRPGGKILIDANTDNDLFVSQICMPEYGSGLIIKEFMLNWPDYKEKELFRLYPQDIKVDKKRKYLGLHTLNYSENYVVIDMVWLRFSIIRTLMRIWNKIRNQFQ